MQNSNSRFFNRGSLNFISRWWIDIDKINFLIIFGIIIFGLAAVATSSPAIAKKIGVSKFFFLEKQAIFALMAMFSMIFISFFRKNHIIMFAVAGFLSCIIALIGVSIFGVEIRGSKRWISFMGFVFQPSEFSKTFFVIVNAYILHKFYDQKIPLKYLLSTLAFGFLAFLLASQPDIGMTITLSLLWASQLFVFGLSMWIVLIVGIIGVAGIIMAYLFLPHVEDRINRFLDINSTNYQVERSLDAYVSGGFLGKGQGQGLVKNFIPDSHTDFIFAVIAEEFGILSCILLILVFLYLITRITKRLLEEEDRFIYISLIGLMMNFTIQTVVNIGVSLRLFPTKGMTLPLVSYGGSSMFAMSICFGLILALTKKKYNNQVDYGNLRMID